MITPQVLVSGLGHATGCAYQLSTNRLFFGEWGTHSIAVLNLSTLVWSVFGAGYDQVDGIALTADDKYAYVTDHAGDLLRVDMAHPDYAHAVVISSGMQIPSQVVLDEARGQAYVVENAGASPALLRIDLTSGAQTILYSGLEASRGLLLTHDYSLAYVTERGYGSPARLIRINLSTGQRQIVVEGLSTPSFLAWAGPDEGAIFINEEHPAHQLTRIDLTQSPPGVLPIASVPHYPDGVAVAGPGKVFVCSQDYISLVDLTADYFSAAGPMLMGIGHVPITCIAGGYATTDPLYFFHVVDAPFGGTLALMINHEAAYSGGARYYRVMVDGKVQTGTWYDYLWSPVTKKFVLTACKPVGAGFYPVRQPSQIWYNHWLGHMTDTSGLTNGPHTISLALFSGMTVGSHIGLPTGVGVQIDNRVPTAAIDQIFHNHHTNGWEPVPVCGIVTEETDEFTFQITAHDPEGHLKSWGLAAWWGDNKSGSVAGEQYPAITNPPGGPVSLEVPPRLAPWHARVPGDWTSYRCAHTFYLEVWDRTIDGWNHIHASSYHKSITILLP